LASTSSNCKADTEGGVAMSKLRQSIVSSERFKRHPPSNSNPTTSIDDTIQPFNGKNLGNELLGLNEPEGKRYEMVEAAGIEPACTEPQPRRSTRLVHRKSFAIDLR
jgi:hypothetical protein